ncbi:MAG TPA: hypothetical protein DEX10_05680, partial [Betaproteobacteria bacterium]|nr:hypothetical protein [Betaproteobacteria bacterium]
PRSRAGVARPRARGAIGDALHVISCAAGHNIRWLMRAIIRLGFTGLFALAFVAAASATFRRFPFA